MNYLLIVSNLKLSERTEPAENPFSIVLMIDSYNFTVNSPPAKISKKATARFFWAVLYDNSPSS